MPNPSEPEPEIVGGDLPVVEPSAPPCRHLRNKGMYVYTDGPGSGPHDDYDSTLYWCVQTLKGFGPDDERVCGHDCRDINRSCYEPY